MDALTGIGEFGDGSFDRLLAGKLIKAFVSDSSEALGAIGLVVVDECVEFLDIDIDLLDISQEGHILPGTLIVPATVINVLLPEILCKVRVVSQLKDVTSRDEPAIVVHERDIVALDVLPRAVY